MGDIKRILSQKKIMPTCDFYKDKMSCESNESLHLHWKNIRLEFNHGDWEVFCKNIILAYSDWVRGKKPLLRLDNNNENTIYLPAPADINPISEFYPQRFQIEEQSNIKTIHIHYRELRLEFSIPEFKEFAEGIKEALEEFKNEK